LDGGILGVGLFVPGDRPDRFAKAAGSGADWIILDLEDAVPFDKKESARAAVREALQNGLRACVRPNAPASELGQADLAMLAGANPASLLIPKTRGPADVNIAREALPGVPIVALIESIDGIVHLDAIAASAGVEALAFGGYDLCAELGAVAEPEVLAAYRARVVFAARVAGITAIDTPFADLDDLAGLHADAVRAAHFGFDGKLAVHPKQVDVIAGAFFPSPDEIARARAVCDAAAGGGAMRVGSLMIDAPLLAAARRVLKRAEGRGRGMAAT
jgi:citrate lyase subunit beta/citryl-CoA lyase